MLIQKIKSFFKVLLEIFQKLLNSDKFMREESLRFLRCINKEFHVVEY